MTHPNARLEALCDGVFAIAMTLLILDVRLPSLGRASLALFAVSAIFPIVGGLFVAASPPRWIGIADVILAAALFGVTAIVVVRGRRSVADPDRLVALRTSQAILGAAPMLIAVYFVAGSHVNWTVLIIGLAWRIWLLIYSLPFLVAALHAQEG